MCIYVHGNITFVAPGHMHACTYGPVIMKQISTHNVDMHAYPCYHSNSHIIKGTGGVIGAKSLACYNGSTIIGNKIVRSWFA